SRPHLAVAANLPRRSGLTQLNHLVASLFAEGVPVQTEHLYARRRPQRLDLSAAPRPVRDDPALAVGCPEIRVSPWLARRLRAMRAAASREVDDRDHVHVNGSNGHAPRFEPNLPALLPAALLSAGFDPGGEGPKSPDDADEAMLSYLAAMD